MEMKIIKFEKSTRSLLVIILEFLQLKHSTTIMWKKEEEVEKFKLRVKVPVFKISNTFL